jgi:ribosomal protein S1
VGVAGVRRGAVADHTQMDGIVTSILPSGFFVDCGSLQAFVGRNV